MTHDEAIAIGFANLKGSKTKNLILTARALQFLKTSSTYDTNKQLGALFGVSGEVVREFLSLLQLPDDLQCLLEERKLSLEHGRRLFQLLRSRPDILQSAAEAMQELTAIEARHLGDYLIRHPRCSVEEAKVELMKAKTTKIHEYHVVAILDKQDYKRLSKLAELRGVSMNDLVSQILIQWLRSENHVG